MSKILEHKHLIIRARVANPPQNCEYIEQWMRELVEKINMKILMGPYCVYSDMVGNRGLTAVTIIETSHIALHVWDEEDPALFQLDVYTCSTLNVHDIFEHIKQFKPTELDYYFIDREDELRLIDKNNMKESE